MARSHRELEEMGQRPRRRPNASWRKSAATNICVPCLAIKSTPKNKGRCGSACGATGKEYQRLVTSYFGLRVLITDRAEWNTAQIIEAYRGQSKVEAAFRDLKDPRMLSTQPQFHGTDQKLHVHAFMCVTAYLLVTLLHRRAAEKAAFEGSSRRLLEELTAIPCYQLIDMTGRKGRPRVRLQIEEMDASRRKLAEALGAVPGIG